MRKLRQTARLTVARSCSFVVQQVFWRLSFSNDKPSDFKSCICSSTVICGWLQYCNVHKKINLPWARCSYGKRGKYVAAKVRHLFGLCKDFGRKMRKWRWFLTDVGCFGRDSAPSPVPFLQRVLFRSLPLLRVHINRSIVYLLVPHPNARFAPVHQ